MGNWKCWICLEILWFLVVSSCIDLIPLPMEQKMKQKLLLRQIKEGKFKLMDVEKTEKMAKDIARKTPMEYGKMFVHLIEYYKIASTEDEPLMFCLGLLYYLASGNKPEFHSLLEKAQRSSKMAIREYAGFDWVIKVEGALSRGYPPLKNFSKPPMEFNSFLKILGIKDIRPQWEYVRGSQTQTGIKLCNSIATNIENEF